MEWTSMCDTCGRAWLVLADARPASCPTCAPRACAEELARVVVKEQPEWMWRCGECGAGWTLRADTPPEKCPRCGELLLGSSAPRSLLGRLLNPPPVAPEAQLLKPVSRGRR